MSYKNNKKRGDKRGPVDDTLDFIPNAARDCGKGCYTIITKDWRTNLWIEFVTGIEHTRRRCKQVQEMQKSKDRGVSSKVPRIDVIMDLEDTLFRLKDGMHPIEKLYHMLKFRKSKDLGVTIKELALALFPELYNWDRDGNKEPTIETIRRIGQYLSKLRKWDLNYVVVSYADRTDTGVILYWNQQTEKDIKEAERRIKAEIEGRKNNLEKAKDVVNLSPEQRATNEKKLDKEIDIAIKTRKQKKKKKDGDSNNGGVY